MWPPAGALAQLISIKYFLPASRELVCRSVFSKHSLRGSVPYAHKHVYILIVAQAIFKTEFCSSFSSTLPKAGGTALIHWWILGVSQLLLAFSQLLRASLRCHQLPPVGPSGPPMPPISQSAIHAVDSKPVAVENVMVKGLVAAEPRWTFSSFHYTRPSCCQQWDCERARTCYARWTFSSFGRTFKSRVRLRTGDLQASHGNLWSPFL